MRPKIGIFMKVFRNEAGIGDAVESVILQTYTNWTFFILVNDETKPVLLKYAERDSRIVLLDGERGDNFINRSKSLVDERYDYWMTLDADDRLMPECAEKLLDFAEVNHCDVTAGAYEFVSLGGEAIEKNGYPKEVVFNCRNMSEAIPFVYGNFRTIWGKLYRANIIRSFSESRIPKIEEYGGYGGDTLFVFNLLYEADTIGIIPDSVYRYTISPTGGTHTLAEGRLKSDSLLFYFVKSFLEEKSVYDEKAARFLYAVYGNAIHDTISLLFEAKIAEDVRRQNIHQVLADPLTTLLLVRDSKGLTACETYYFLDMLLRLFYVDNKYFLDYDDYVLLCTNRRSLLDKEEYELLCRLPGAVAGYYQDNNEGYQKNLFHIYLKIGKGQAETMLGIIKKCADNILLNELLKQTGFLCKYPEIVHEVIDNNLPMLLNRIREIVLSGEEQEYLEILLELWSNVAALTENSEEFIFAQEIKIDFLIDQNRKNEAEKMLKELISMGVEDENIVLLTSALEN